MVGTEGFEPSLTGLELRLASKIAHNQSHCQVMLRPLNAMELKYCL